MYLYQTNFPFIFRQTKLTLLMVLRALTFLHACNGAVALTGRAEVPRGADGIGAKTVVVVGT
jgi:hypothetical protein